MGRAHYLGDSCISITVEKGDEVSPLVNLMILIFLPVWIGQFNDINILAFMHWSI